MWNSSPNIASVARFIEVQFSQRDSICLHSRSYPRSVPAVSIPYPVPLKDVGKDSVLVAALGVFGPGYGKANIVFAIG